MNLPIIWQRVLVGLIFVTAALSVSAIITGLTAWLEAQPPAITDIYPLTFEQNDFPPATAGQTSFVTAAAPKNRAALVFRNGLFQRPCAVPVSSPCDYTKTGTSTITVTFPAGVIQPGDLVSILYFR